MKWVVIVTLLLLAPFASAELLFSQIDDMYSLGDQINTQVTIVPAVTTNDFFDVTLVCGSDRQEIYRQPLSVSGGATLPVQLSFALGSAFIGSLSGTCLLEASFGDETKQSPSFELSRILIVDASLRTTLFSPQEKIVLQGTAFTPDGGERNGFVDIRVDDTTLTSAPLVEGRFNASITLPSALSPGIHSFSIYAYDIDEAGNPLNEGSSVQTITIREVLTSLDISLGSDETDPGVPFSFVPRAFNQIGAEMSEEIAVSIISPSGKVLRSLVTPSSEVQSAPLPVDATPGIWTIRASSGSFVKESTFTVNELEKAQFDIINNSLYVVNIGNVPYDREVEIALNNFTVIQRIQLTVGEQKWFKLSAPSDSYSVVIYDGAEQLRTSGVPLTGRAVDIGELSGFSYSQLIFPIVIILILVILFFVIRVYNRKRHDIFDEPKLTPVSTKKMAMPTSATYTEGVKEEGVMLSVVFRERPAHEGGRKIITEVISLLKSSGAHVRDTGQAINAVYTQRLVSDPSFALTAVRTAYSCQQLITGHNQTSRLHVHAGIGASLGMMITGSNKNTFTYNALGNVVSKAQNLASHSLRQGSAVLLNESLYRKVMTEVGAEKVHDSVWKVTKVQNREQHSKFISGFLGRQDKKR